MSPEDKKRFQRIFLQVFDDEWFEGFETSIQMDEAEAAAYGQAQLTEEDYGLDGRPLDDSILHATYPQAKAWFLTFWDLFKIECYKEKIILERHEAKELCFTFLDRHDIWGHLVDEDRDFACFEDMRAKFEEDKAYAEAQRRKNAPAQERIARRRAIRTLVLQNLIRSAKKTEEKRLAVPFAEELEELIKALEENGIQTYPNEIATVIHKTMPHIPMSLLQLLLNYKERIANIQPCEVIEPEEIMELPEEQEIVRTSEPEIDPESNQLVILEKEYTIGFNGLTAAFEVLANQDHNPMEFYTKFKDLLDSIHVHCQKASKLGGLLKLIYKLQEHYKEKWDRKNKTPYGMKIGFIYSGLGLKHAQLAEAMPSTFGNGSKFKCQ